MTSKTGKGKGRAAEGEGTACVDAGRWNRTGVILNHYGSGRHCRGYI